ncbi:unnamed protein product [Bemisia tabaci]|uniref:Cytochrome b-c1 complex subunit 6 n=1 Tax=Bemisia tabaci TaxID=7038 RepID=A0A9P0AJH9_BEMTA|nr:unnamed protein product [Bemisia tabaci]
MFGDLLKRFFKLPSLPVIKADDEELVDPQNVLREKCNQDHHAQELFKRLEDCNARVRSRKKTTEMCDEELIDYLHHIDHCVAKTLFEHLK